MYTRSRKSEFSKTLLRQESMLIWILSISFVLLAFYCIHQNFTGSLPWLAAMIGFPWTAYGVSQALYYKKSQAENTKDGIKYESVLLEAKQRMASNTITIEEIDPISILENSIIDIDSFQI